MAQLVLAPREFSIAEGPFPHALHRLHLTRADGSPRAWALVTIAWVPLLVGALLHVIVGQQPAPILFDISVHSRLLVTIPLLIVGERQFLVRARDAIEQLYEGKYADRAVVDRIVDRAERLRDSRTTVLLLGVLVIFDGLGTLTGIFGATGMFGGIEDPGALSFARLWYALVALPIAQFLLLSWLWHWAIWSYIVVRVSRLKLDILPTHPDHSCGLEFLSRPLSAFALLVFAASATLASVWATRILAGQTTIKACIPGFVGFLLVALVIACGPLLAFIPDLFRARYGTVRKYDNLALRYTRGFHRKWITGERPEEPLLGTSDIQSLNDLIGAYESLVSVRFLPFGLRPILMIVAAAVVPMVPLAFTEMAMTEVLQRLGEMFVGLVA